MPVQSRELCYPFKIIIAKDTKELCNTSFADFFAFFQQVEGLENSLSRSMLAPLRTCPPYGNPLRREEVARTGHFRHCSSLTKERVHLAHPIPCQVCVKKNRAKCYHYPVGDAATLAAASERLLSMALNHPHLADRTIKEQLNVRFDKNQLEAMCDMGNILFLPENIQE
jgi:hypothetical protein